MTITVIRQDGKQMAKIRTGSHPIELDNPPQEMVFYIEREGLNGPLGWPARVALIENKTETRTEYPNGRPTEYRYTNLVYQIVEELSPGMVGLPYIQRIAQQRGLPVIAEFAHNTWVSR